VGSYISFLALPVFFFSVLLALDKKPSPDFFQLKFEQMDVLTLFPPSLHTHLEPVFTFSPKK
jgi:hypothetical protein